MEQNSPDVRDLDFTLLCVARVWPEDWCFGTDQKPYSDQIGKDGKVPCGMQWCPKETAS